MDRVVLQPELRRCALVDLEALACVRGCLTRAHQGKVVAPAFMALPLRRGGADVGVQGGAIDGIYSAALRIMGRAPDRTHHQAVLLLHPDTGEFQAWLQDDGYLTHLAQALAGAAGVAAVAPEGPSSVAVLGAPEFADLYVRALALVRDLDRVTIHEEDSAQAQALVDLLAQSEIPAEVREEPPEAARLVLALGAAPVPGILGKDTVIVAAPDVPWTMEARHALERRVADDPSRSLLGARLGLGALTAGEATLEGEGPTLVELTGHPMLDTAIAFLAWRKSQKYKLGSVVG